MTRFSVFLTTVALIAGMAGCTGGGGGANGDDDDHNLPPSENLEIGTWHDLDAIRNNLAGNHTLMNDLDSTTPGCEALASPTANQGRGWEPIGFVEHVFWDYPWGGGGMIENWYGLNGTFDGQAYEIRDLFIDRPDESHVGLLGVVDEGGIIKDIGAVNVNGIGGHYVGGLVGASRGTVSDSFWDVQTSGEATSDGGTGKTATEMKSIATFSGAGWNIVAVADPGTRDPSYIWNIVDGETYPFLSWQ